MRKQARRRSTAHDSEALKRALEQRDGLRKELDRYKAGDSRKTHADLRRTAEQFSPVDPKIGATPQPTAGVATKEPRFTLTVKRESPQTDADQIATLQEQLVAVRKDRDAIASTVERHKLAEAVAVDKRCEIEAKLKDALLHRDAAFFCMQRNRPWETESDKDNCCTGCPAEHDDEVCEHIPPVNRIMIQNQLQEARQERDRASATLVKLQSDLAAREFERRRSDQGTAILLEHKQRECDVEIARRSALEGIVAKIRALADGK